MTKPEINPESILYPSDSGQLFPRISPEKNRILNVFFFTALGMTLAAGSWLWVARAGWMLLAILFAINMRFGFYALFFFAAWFHPTGFIQKLFFSLKHFQIALLISLTVHLINGNPLTTLLNGLKRSETFFFPWFLILGIGLFNCMRFGITEQSLMTPLNLLSIIAAMLYLLGRCEQIQLDTPEEKTVSKCLAFFTFGVLSQVLIAFQNTVAHTLHFNMPLLHNNHIGILCAFSSFFPMALFLSEHEPLKKKLWALVTLILISATVASCSRTAWLSFLGSFFIFFILARRFQPKTDAIKFRKRHTLSLICAMLGAAVILSRFYETVFYRFIGLIKLMDWQYWKYTFTDYQNFGFLGIFRLQQIYAIKDILTAQPFLGIGFVNNVMDFHGFYFIVLGGTGAVGFVTFIYFFRKTLHMSLRKICKGSETSENFFLLLASTCSFIVWLLCSFMETYVVQFSVWIIFWTLSALLYPVWNVSRMPHENS